LTQRLLYILFLILPGLGPLQAQPPAYVEIAQPFKYTIQADANSRAPQTGEMIGVFEILEVTTAATKAGENNVTYELLLAAYETGKFILPQVLNAASANNYNIEVTEPPGEKIKSYAPPKELQFPAEKEPATSWLPFLIGLLAAAILAWYLWKNRSTSPQTPIAFNPNGMALLQEVKAQWKAGKIDSLTLGDGLVGSLQLQYNVPVKRSSRQLIKVITKQQPFAVSKPMENTLKLCDAWRFGKQVASSPEGLEAISVIENLFLATPHSKNLGT
jgi:hypothetical protein